MIGEYFCKQIWFSLVALGAVVLAACGAATPVPTVEPPAPTTTPVPTLNATQLATAVAAASHTPILAATATLDPTQAVLFSTPLPSPTSDGSPYPITWRVTPYTTYDGRTAYMVDDKQVLRGAEGTFEKWRTIMAFQDGLPSREQHKKDIEALIDNPDWVTQLLEKFDTWTNEWGGYWSRPGELTFDWSDEAAEFTADGSQVVLAVRTPSEHNEWTDFKSGRITNIQDNGEALWKVVIHYNNQTGKWMLVGATAQASEGPVITVTPSN